MALDPTSREANVRDSLKKYFIDSLVTTEGLKLSFDKSMARPKIQGQPVEVEKWVIVNFGYLDRGTMSEHQIDVVTCSRKDNEGFKLAQLGDTVMGYLTDSTQTDGMRRITFYRSSTAASADWPVLGGILITDIAESPQMDADDETKFKIFTVTLKFASKV